MSTRDSSVDSRPTLLPAIIGIGLAGGLILALGFWVSRQTANTNRHPEVRILSPAQDTVSDGRISLVFTTTSALELLPTGWGTGQYHLHALVNGVERMPAASDIRRAPTGEYQWTLTELADSAEIQLVWALPSHRRTAAGSSPVLLVRRSRP